MLNFNFKLGDDVFIMFTFEVPYLNISLYIIHLHNMLTINRYMCRKYNCKKHTYFYTFFNIINGDVNFYFVRSQMNFIDRFTLYRCIQIWPLNCSI